MIGTLKWSLDLCLGLKSVRGNAYGDGGVHDGRNDRHTRYMFCVSMTTNCAVK